MIEEFLSSLIPQGKRGLDTKKIDKNIQYLLKDRWFKEIYEMEKYHHLFLTNRNIRSYLESNRRVKKLVTSNAYKKKFIEILDQQNK